MPVAVEQELIHKALSKGWGRKKKNGEIVLTERGRAFVYGTLRNKFGWHKGSKTMISAGRKR